MELEKNEKGLPCMESKDEKNEDIEDIVAEMLLHYLFYCRFFFNFLTALPISLPNNRKLNLNGVRILMLDRACDTIIKK